ncbi:MAG: hypothetical protein ABIO72_02355 [Patescibacteria group bacterium]
MEDLRLHCLEQLRRAGAELPKSDDVSSVLKAIHRLKWRLIEARPRDVYVSRVLRDRLAHREELRRAVNDVIIEIEEGESLTPRLSRSVFRLKYDRLFNTWGIHHLHLAERIPGARLVEGANEVLFVRVHSNVMLFIDVRPHGLETYVDRELLEIVHAEWPESIVAWRPPSTVQGLESDEVGEIAPELRHQMRVVGINTMTQMKDGTVYCNPAVMLGGLPFEVRRRVDARLDLARKSEAWARANSDHLASVLGAQAGRVFDELHLTFVPNVNPRIRETTSGEIITIPTYRAA